MLKGHTLENTFIVADFDRTITTWEPGCETAFNVFWSTPNTPPEMLEERTRLFEKYRPIEMNDSMNPEVQLQHMRDWHHAAMEVMWKYIDPQRMEQVIRHAQENIKIRGWIKEFFDLSTYYQVPRIIFSAGVTNIIEWVLGKKSIGYDVAHGNTLWFQDGVCWLVNKWVFIGNKNWESLPEEIHDLVSKKTHMILLWDSLWDLEMSDPNRTVTSIWFLLSEHKSKGDAEIYHRSFDHVIESDANDNGILKKISTALVNGA